ncbi:hypothetical protein OFB65_26065, partial [Escherichia coli]|nr:hypothetical protein [Escherichia coli]
MQKKKTKKKKKEKKKRRETKDTLAKYCIHDRPARTLTTSFICISLEPFRSSFMLHVRRESSL